MLGVVFCYLKAASDEIMMIDLFSMAYLIAIKTNLTFVNKYARKMVGSESGLEPSPSTKRKVQ